jgi:CheY-like chemotaxis protein
MPHLTGLEFAAEVLRTRADLPIVLTTGAKNPLAPEIGVSLGIRGLLAKPFDFRSLAEALAKALRSAKVR